MVPISHINFIIPFMIPFHFTVAAVYRRRALRLFVSLTQPYHPLDRNGLVSTLRGTPFLSSRRSRRWLIIPCFALTFLHS